VVEHGLNYSPVQKATDEKLLNCLGCNMKFSARSVASVRVGLANCMSLRVVFTQEMARPFEAATTYIPLNQLVKRQGKSQRAVADMEFAFAELARWSSSKITTGSNGNTA
jgi:hypothetical protein